jgi:hypothetical protein
MPWVGLAPELQNLTSMQRFLAWFLTACLLLVLGLVVLRALQDRAEAGRDVPAYSVYSEAADGLGEAAHLLRQLGLAPEALTRPIHQTQHRGLLILVSPEEGSALGGGAGMSEGEASALLRWVAKGNTLLLSSRTNTPIHQALGIVVTEPARGDSGLFTAVELASSGYTEDVDRLTVGCAATLHASAQSLPLWWVEGKLGAVVVRQGMGRVVVVADPELLTRRGLVRADGEPRDDNLMFLVNLAWREARDGKVYFDEFHHGIRSGGGFWGYLGFYGQRWTLLLLLIVLGAAAWTWAVRLGPAVPTPPARTADAVDYASALARLYQKAGASRLLARILARDFLGALTRHLHLRNNALPAVILAGWNQQHPGPSGERLQGLLRGIGELRKGDLGDAQVLAWAGAFDQFLQDMQKTVK